MPFHAIPGSTFTLYLPGLEDQANAGLFKSSPTIAAGDFTISINGGATDSLDNTPTVKPAGGTQIEIVLSASETTAAGDGGSITVNCVDAAGAEWYSVGVVVRVGYPAVNVTTWDGGALPTIPSVEDIWQDTYSGMSHEQAVYNAGLGGAQISNMVEGGGDLDYQYKAYALENAPSGGLTAQETRDAMKLAPTAGDPAAGSVDKHLDDLAVDIAACGSIVANSTDDTEPGSITRRRGNSWSISLTLGDITGWTSLWFTIKSNDDDIDSAAILQVKLNATGLLDGLLYVNGAAATNDALGSITVSNAGTGAIVVAVDETITDDLTPGEYVYDAQVLIAGNVSTPDSGTFTVTSDVTRSVV